MSDRRNIIIAGAGALALLLAGGWWMAQNRANDIFASCRAPAMGNAAALGGPFTLTDENGQRVTEGQVFSEPALLYFGYTFCPDVCPADTARNAAAVDILAGRGVKARPVFISVDPARDTPERLSEFTDLIHPEMLGLTGTAPEVAAAAKQWRVIYDIKDQEDKSSYLVDHSTKTYLVMPDHGTVAAFDRNESPEAMADSVACFVEAARPKGLTQP